MLFQTPGDVSFEIPDDWWRFTEMERFKPSEGGYYPYCQPKSGLVEIVSLSDVEPLRRNKGVALFKKYKLVPVLFAFASPECALPPVELNPINSSGQYRYKVHNGCHRYYASIAAGYTKLPAVVFEPFVGCAFGIATMDMPNEWQRSLRSWASGKES
ncbi:MAG: hypothetical protein QOE73_380, partial [Verrucomicrobiota bacterium]